ncbi:MAG: hypothetical protein HWN65_20480 [Candidatus Helarchaeota archaeon]|nr:hypothetical protein [Candidatus Helarchaeota archaeon]
MSVVKKNKKYFLLMLLISSFLIMANYLTIPQQNPNVEPVREGDLAILNTDENVTYITVPITINYIKGTVVSMAEIQDNIEEMNEIFKNNTLNQPSAIFIWDYQIHEIDDPEGNNDGVIEYDIESRDRVRGLAEDSAGGKGMSITLCNSTGQPELFAITNIGESHGAILTTETDGSDWAHEMQHAIGLDHGPVQQADEDMDGVTDPLMDFYDVGNDANGDGIINNQDRNYNMWGIRRTRFYQGQFLTADDFCMEQTYHTRKLRLNNRFFHGWGIICGLELHDNQSDTINITSALQVNKMSIDLKASKIRINSTTNKLASKLQWSHKLVDSTQDNCSYEIIIDNKSAPGSVAGFYAGANIRLNISKILGSFEVFAYEWNDGLGIWEQTPLPMAVVQETEIVETMCYNNNTGSGYVGGIRPSNVTATLDESVMLQQLGIGGLGQGEYDYWSFSKWLYDSGNSSRYLYDITEKETVVDMQVPQPLFHTITPPSVHRGGNITLTATGFAPNANVTIWVDGINASVIKANSTGGLNNTVTMPPSLNSNLTIISANPANLTSVAAYITIYSTVPRLAPITPDPSLTGVINLNWNDVINATIYYVYRNTSFISSTTGLTPIATSIPSTYQDNVANGIYYYAIVAGNGTANSTLSNCENVTVAIPPAPPSLPGKIFVYVDSAIYKSINASLQQFKADLEATGKNVTLINFTSITGSNFIDASQIRTQCIASYASGLEGIIFVGSLPYVNYEIYNVPFPCDLYFMDLDGQWTDIDFDNAFDNHSAGTGDRDPEIWLGRIDASTMSGRNETTALNNYFQRNHLYRNGSLTRPHSSLIHIDDDWSPWTSEWVGESVHAYTNQTVLSNDSLTIDTYYENELPKIYEWVHVFVHSYYDKHIWKPFYTSGYTYGSEIRNINTAPLFFLLYACSAADFSRSNNIATEYQFSNNTLATIGCTRTGGMLEPSWFYKPLGNNSNLGDAFVRWFSDCTLPSAGLNNPANSYGMTLFGDPTLKILYGPLPNPPVLSNLTRTNSTVHLQWTNVPDAALYYIYRNTSQITSTAGLTPVGWTMNNHTDDVLFFNGTYFYAVVAGNDFTNSSISNCENITVNVTNPIQLEPITPNPSTTGIITLNWSAVTNATIYYIYRATSYISSVSGMTPLATTNVTTYQDSSIPADGTYYYVIVAGNPLWNTSISNCVGVTVSTQPDGTPGFGSALFWAVLCIALLGFFVLILVYLRKKKSPL